MDIIKQKCRTAAAFLIIVVLLPYIASVFINGADLHGDRQGAFYVKVRVPDMEEADGVTEIDWTDYLTGVLARDVSGDCGEEALKALAVLIRTQIYRELDHSEDGILTAEYLTGEEMRERWGEEQYRTYRERFTRAVEATDDMVLMYGEQFAWTPFHQSSCGMTRSAEEVLGSADYPYIALRECPLDKEADEEIQMRTCSYADIQRLCRDFLVAEADDQRAAGGYGFEDFEICARDSAGYVSELRIGSTVCTGDRFRDALSLPSSAFTLSEGGGDTLCITTTGKGHGLGLSIWTAEQMAEDGSTFEEILMFFFEGAELRKDMPETELS